MVKATLDHFNKLVHWKKKRLSKCIKKHTHLFQVFISYLKSALKTPLENIHNQICDCQKKSLWDGSTVAQGKKKEKKNSLLKKQNHSIFYSFEVKQSHKIFILGIRSQLWHQNSPMGCFQWEWQNFF